MNCVMSHHKAVTGRCSGLVHMSDEEFTAFSGFIYDVCGINMKASKKMMLEARLQKRLRSLMLNSFKEYAELLFSKDGLEKELPFLINVVTTNKTEFFREPAHFHFLVETALPEILHTNRKRTGPVRIWSAGCSSGEEPYTLAMILSEAAPCSDTGFSILATDLSTAVLEKARLGIYFEETIAEVPLIYRQKYFLKSRDRVKRLVRVVPMIRELVDFKTLNFISDDYRVPRAMDIIFCRNVIIYFDRQTQKNVLSKLFSHLTPGGYLFLGHSETLSGFDFPLTQVASTVYRKP